MIFYDLTAFVVHGEYTGSAHVDFGFAHNTPMDKRKFKTGLDVSADENIPLEYALWNGRTADLATVQANMERLCRLLQSQGRSGQETLIIGDRAKLRLRWWIDRYSLWLAMQQDGRYLLVTNDWSLSPQRMFDLYCQKDGVEKDFKIAKSDLKVSPIYLHKDDRIAGMLLINMLALLTYSLLERQTRQHGWLMTTRRIIATLESLDVIETWCWDGSVWFRCSRNLY